MSQMKELYAKVAADSALQAKFSEIMKNAEAAGKEATEEKLVAFAKDAGYDVSIEEAKAFFNEQGKSSGELDDADLEMVAGGKQSIGQWIDGTIGKLTNFGDDIANAFNKLF